MRASVAGLLRPLLLPVVSLACGLAVGAVAVAISGADPGQAFLALFEGAFTSTNGLPETLVASIPYVFLGLAVAVGFRAGLFNIGADGQLYLGALGAVWVGVSLHGLPAVVEIPLALGAGVLAGAVWGAVPGALKARFGAHEVITTIMLNYVAYNLTAFLINGGPLLDHHSSVPRTPPADPHAWLPLLVPGTRLHVGLVLALLAIPGMWFLLARTTAGFQIRSVGLNALAARGAGMSVGWTYLLVMGLSGGLAGLAGADEVLGVSHYMPPSFSIGYGFDAIAVALLARGNPWAIAATAFLFGALRNGAPFMQLQTQVSSDLISIVQAIVIMFVAAPLLVRTIFRLRLADPRAVQITQREEVTTG